MLLRCSIALDCLRKTLPPIDEDQTLDLLHAPFKGTEGGWEHLSRPNQPIPTEWSLHPEKVSRIFGVWGTPVVDMFATVLKSSIPPHWRWMLCLRTGRGCHCTCFLGSPAQQGCSETTVDTGGRSDSDSPLVAKTVMVSTPTSSLQWTIHCSFLTADIFCHNRIRDTSRTESRTVCMHGGSRATLQRRGL